MTEEQRKRVLAGKPLIADDVHDKQRLCSCGRRFPIPDLAKQCEANH